MEHTVIKKRLNTYKSDGGRLSKVDDEVVLDVQNWEGSCADLNRELGLSKMQLVTMIKKGKKLVKKGAVTGSEFKEITLVGGVVGSSGAAGYGIELSWEGGKQIRFREVGQLLEFLKKANQSDNI